MNTSDIPASQSPDSSPVAVFSMKQAAQVAGISVSTLRRRRAELEAAGAVISSDGWKVPITSLEALGLMHSSASASAAPSSSPAPKENPDSGALREAQERIRELEAENVELRHRADMAEAIARERLDALNAERLALRMIVASPSTPYVTGHEENNIPGFSSPRDLNASAARPSWWRRAFK